MGRKYALVSRGDSHGNTVSILSLPVVLKLALGAGIGVILGTVVFVLLGSSHDSALVGLVVWIITALATPALLRSRRGRQE